MRKIAIITAAVLVIGGATLGWWLLQNQPASAPKNKMTQSTGKTTKTVDPNEHSYTDVDFAQKMIIHNQQGIQIADIAKKNAASEEVRQIAASISEELSTSTKQYIDWLTEWKETYFNLSDFPEMEGKFVFKTNAPIIEKLKNSGHLILKKDINICRTLYLSMISQHLKHL